MFGRYSVSRAGARAGLFAAVAVLASAQAAGSSGERVSASSIHSNAYPANHAVDGNRKTRWASRPVSGKPEWLQIDFGKRIPVEAVTLHWERAHAAAYRLEISDDARRWRTVHENMACEGGQDNVSDLEARGRYLRLLCLEPGPYKLVSLFEIEFPGNGPAAAVIAQARRQAAESRRQANAQARQRLSRLPEQFGVDEIIFAMRQPGKDGHWYANFSYYADDEERLTYGQGGKLCRMDLETGEVTAILEDPKGAVRDPVVHYDAKKILFSYRRGGSAHYHLYEINMDGGDMRQLTDGPYDDIEPCYLPDNSIVFVSSRCKRWVQCWLTKVAVMYRCGPNGENIRPISCNVEHDNTPWPLPDGRILYQRWEYIDRSQVHYHHLWTTNPDGTGQMVYYGNMHPGIVMIDAKPIPNTKKVVAVFSPGHGRREHVGTITIVDPRKGPDDQSSAISITSEPKYRDPWAFSEETFLAARGDRLVLLDNQGHARDIYQATAEEVAAGLECHEPRPVMRRRRERVMPSRADRAEATGKVVLMDVHKGRNMAGVDRGEIEKLLVVESLPKPINFTGGMDPLTYGGSFTLERALGTIPVDEDGSAFAELPALRSLFFVALDENDMAVKRMQSFLTVQPGEVAGCVGCHERRTESLLPEVHALATGREASKIEPIADNPGVFDFPRDIQPILDNLC
ncbi:MAG: discoidin domain-containing protein, partial [Pirellulaceae bacterium]